MLNEQYLKADELKRHTIKVIEPFAEFLKADTEESEFQISALDVVRFAGHACPSIIGAFIISQRAVRELFPAPHVCIRGQVAISLPSSVTQGATGPISNVFSMIFGAWDKSGFPGLQGRFVRRGLLSYDNPQVPMQHYRFRNLQSGQQVDINYQHSHAPRPDGATELPFQEMWRYKLAAILRDPGAYITAKKV